jgi:hypothetical protein
MCPTSFFARPPSSFDDASRRALPNVLLPAMSDDGGRLREASVHDWQILEKRALLVLQVKGHTVCTHMLLMIMPCSPSFHVKASVKAVVVAAVVASVVAKV